MSRSTLEKPDGRQRGPLMPPPERFWKKYSPRHEFPLSSAVSIFLHALAIGLILLVGYLAQLRWYQPENQPPANEMVMLEGEGGLEGGGGAPGLPGDDKTPFEIEGRFAEVFPKDLDANLFEPSPLEDHGVEIELGAFKDREEQSKTDILKTLESAAKEPETKKAAPATAAPVGPRGKKERGMGGNKGGAGGLGGGGLGSGKGRLFGPGTGTGGSKKGTSRQRYLAQRWSFGMGETPQEHLALLEKFGFVVGIEGFDGRFYTVRDIKKRPVELKMDNLQRYEGLPSYQNTDIKSVEAIRRLMGIPFPVRRTIMAIMVDRQKDFLKEEIRFAKAIGRPLHTFKEIWFNFELRDGRYMPVAFKVEPQDPRVYSDPSVYAFYGIRP